MPSAASVVKIWPAMLGMPRLHAETCGIPAPGKQPVGVIDAVTDIAVLAEVAQLIDNHHSAVSARQSECFVWGFGPGSRLPLCDATKGKLEDPGP